MTKLIVAFRNFFAREPKTSEKMAVRIQTSL